MSNKFKSMEPGELGARLRQMDKDVFPPDIRVGSMSQEQYVERFKEVVAELVSITESKNADYAGANDAFKNFRIIEHVGVTSTEIGILTRLSDKFVRACNLISKPAAVETESIMDTLTDLAVYSIILRIYLENK